MGNYTRQGTKFRYRAKGPHFEWLRASDLKTRGVQAFSSLGPDPVEMGVDMKGAQRMAGGQWLRTWQFGEGFNGDRSVPGPVIEGIEGQLVEVTLSSGMPHTIHFHGLDVDQANDGVPATSGYVGGMGGNPMGSGFGRVSGYDNLGSPFTYRFVAPHAGTYMYHCHVDTVLHFEMGMVGTVIIRPPDGGRSHLWADGPGFDREYIWHLHTFDSSWHSETVSGPKTVRHRPDYFMINGRNGALALKDPATAVLGASGEKVLIRLINIGYQPAFVRLGGLEFDVVSSDGRPLPAPISVNEYLVSPGERYDIMFTLPIDAKYKARIEYLDIQMRKIIGHASTWVEAV